MSDGASEWLTTGEAAELVGVSIATIRRWQKMGRLPGYRTPSNRRYFKRRDIEAAIVFDEPVARAE